MLVRMKQECKTSILYMSQDFAQLKLISDSLGMIADGDLCELGPAEEVLECPRSAAMREALDSASRRASRARHLGELRDAYAAMLHDRDMNAPWLPNAKGEGA